MHTWRRQPDPAPSALLPSRRVQRTRRLQRPAQSTGYGIGRPHQVELGKNREGCDGAGGQLEELTTVETAVG